MLGKAIQERYSQNKESGSLGCANLWPYLKINAGDSILDLGCGNGSQTVAYADASGPSGFVAGIDLTPLMIEKARASDVKYPIDFKVGDIHDLPYPNNLFDLVVSNCVINHSPDKTKVYSEIYRVLKTGGKCVVGDIVALEKLPKTVASDPAAIAACWGGAVTREDYVKAIKSAGFTEFSLTSARQYMKNGFPLESIIIQGVKR